MTREINENELEIKFLKVYKSFKKNNINKIQRYLVNNHGLKAINGRTPLSKAKVREFVVDRDNEYFIRLSWGSREIALISVGSIEQDKKKIVNALKEVYQDLYADEYIGDFWNYFSAHPELTRKTFLESKTDENTSRVKLDKDVLQIMDRKFSKPKQLSYQGGAA